jgi:hypothetical protein
MPNYRSKRMANLFIGSSIINRHYRSADFTDFRKYELVKCTQATGFKVYVDNIDSSRKSVLVSVIENFIVDAVGADVIKPEALIDEAIKDYLSTILTAAVRLPGTRFGLVMPLQRPAVAWYQEQVEAITNFLEDGIKSMISDKNINNVVSIACVSVASQQFEPDQIHLTRASAKTFLEVTLGLAETFFKAPFVDLTEQGEVNDSDEAAHIARLEDRLERLERTMRMQMDTNVANDLMLARVREEVDAGTNKAKEDRVVINGLTSSKPLPEDTKPRIEALKLIVADIFKSIIPDFRGKIVYLSQGKHAAAILPMVEVKLDKAEYAIEMRKAFADKKKKNQLSASHANLFMSNSVNLATRIRVDIMKSIARRITKRDEIAYVAGFTSRPTMHIRRAGGGDTSRPLKSFSFIDSVSRFGNLLDRKDLETAYGRAGRSFNGQLRQNFVVLNEIEQEALFSVNPNLANQQRGQGPSGRGGAGGPRGGGGQRGTKRSGDNIERSASKK